MNRSIPIFLLALEVVALGGVVAPASAQETAPADPIAQIREMVMFARYREAMSALRDYLDREDLDAQARNAGLEALATAQLAMRDEAAAHQTLATLYARDPEHRLQDPDASPVVQAAFQRARSQRGEANEVELSHQSPEELPLRQTPTIEVALTRGADAVQDVRLSYQQGANAGWVHVDVDVVEGVGTARIPLASVEQAYAVRYYIEALAPSRAVLATIGTPQSPIELTVPAAGGSNLALVPSPTADSSQRDAADGHGGGVARKWWFWTLVGGVLVAGAVTGGVLASGGSDAPPNGTLGTFTLAP